MFALLVTNAPGSEGTMAERRDLSVYFFLLGLTTWHFYVSSKSKCPFGRWAEPSSFSLQVTKSFSFEGNPLRLGFQNKSIYTTWIRVFPSRGLFMSGRIAWAAYDVIDFPILPSNVRPSKANTSKSNQCASSNVYLDGHNQLRSPAKYIVRWHLLNIYHY